MALAAGEGNLPQRARVGLEENLTLQRLGLAEELGRSFKTTNAIESVNAGVGQRTDKVDRWRNSNQIQRWVAAAALEVESRLRKVCDYKHLAKLRVDAGRLTREKPVTDHGTATSGEQAS